MISSSTSPRRSPCGALFGHDEQLLATPDLAQRGVNTLLGVAAPVERDHFFGCITPNTKCLASKNLFAAALMLSLVTRLTIASTSLTTSNLSPK